MKDFLHNIFDPVAAGIIIAFVLALIKVAFGHGEKVESNSIDALLDVIKSNEERVDRLERKVEHHEERQREQEIVNQRLRNNLNRWHIFYRDLASRWKEHRSKPAPPLPPEED